MSKRKRGSKKLKRLFPRHMSATFVKCGGGVSTDLHYELNRSHIESLGVPDSGQTIKPWWDETRKNQPHKTHKVPRTLPVSAEVARRLDIPRFEVNRSKRICQLNNGELVREPFLEKIYVDDEHRKLSISFYEGRVRWVEVYRHVNKMRVSQLFPSVLAAQRAKRLGEIRWGQWIPVAASSSAAEVSHPSHSTG